MERFLSQSAKYIYTEHGHQLHNICLVFPNRRSGVFFTSYLRDELPAAAIGPETTTIGELFSNCSIWQPAEKLQLISILYDVFRKHTQSKETFDEFFFWGEILLADFSDIDRYLVDAKDLFRNVADIKEIDTVFDYLTAEQKQALLQFWGAVAVADRKEFQQKYIGVWEKLYPVYAEFKSLLEKQGIAFGGMSDRQVVENLASGSFVPQFKKYIFIGLNALNNCEKQFFKFLQKQGLADFLWDYDRFYLDDNMNEAGKFMRQNLTEFAPPENFDFNTGRFAQEKNIKLVAVSSNYGQAQQIPNFMRETADNFSPRFDNTAIVLADETLLYPALGAIPKNIDTVNITMGYPVRNSMIYGFLMLLVNLLKNAKKTENGETTVYHRYVTDILNHQLFANWETEKSKLFLSDIKSRNRITVPIDGIDFSALHTKVFALPGKVENYSTYFLGVLGEIYQKLKTGKNENKMLLEIIFTIYQSVEKLGQVIESVLGNQNREISNVVYFRLFNQYLGQVSVAFEGEPLSGLQVMGILETRCLDFQNLIILGLNENKWPRTYTAPSFIPANLRKGFGLPGIEEQDALYAYYFYRLVQRAKNITGTYSVVKEGISTGELSRYGFQLRYDSMHRPQLANLEFRFANDPVQAIEIHSSPSIVAHLLGKNTDEHPLSPSAINLYLMCPLRFYFRYVLGLPEPDEMQEEIDGMIFGNIFHDTIEALYKPYVGQVLSRDELKAIKKNKLLVENEIRRNIGIHYFKEKKGSNKTVVLEGKTLLIYENLKTYLNRLLEVDAHFSPISLVSLERQYQTELEIELAGESTAIKIGGKIDRVDRVGNVTRIIDYKTGNVGSLSFKSVEELFERDQKHPKKEILQALIYTWALSETGDKNHYQPGIYGLRKLFDDNFKPMVRYNGSDFSFEELKSEFLENLKMLVAEIFSPNNTFYQTPHTDNCKYCPYRQICQRY